MGMLLDRMKKLREDLGLTQESFGQKVGVTGKTIWRMENGEREIKTGLLLQIASALNTSVAYLIGEVDDPAPHPIDLTLPKSEMPHALADRIKMNREAKGWTVEALSEIVRLPVDKIIAWENGTPSTGEDVAALAAAFEITPAYLIHGKEPSQSAQDLDYLIRELASKNPDLVWRLRNTCEKFGELREETKQSLADGLKYVLGMIELDDLPGYKHPKSR
jgi:transcriptional regulator with XRE-family HTH domain